MKARTHSRPHPVLSPFADDVQPNNCSLKLSASHDNDFYYFYVELAYDNTTLATLVNKGSATHAVHIECRRNYYRELVRFQNNAHSFQISARDVAGQIEVAGFVLAHQEIRDLRIRGAHPDYGDAGFDVLAGDVLALTDTVSVDLSIDYDRLASIASILTIECSREDTTGPMKVLLDGERITAKLAQDDYSTYTAFKHDPAYKTLVMHQVVIPALLHALNDVMQMSPEDYQDARDSRRWMRSLDMACQRTGLSLHPSIAGISGLDILQTLLRLPLRRSLTAINDIAKDTQDEA